MKKNYKNKLFFTLALSLLFCAMQNNVKIFAMYINKKPSNHTNNYSTNMNDTTISSYNKYCDYIFFITKKI